MRGSILITIAYLGLGINILKSMEDRHGKRPLFGPNNGECQATEKSPDDFESFITSLAQQEELESACPFFTKLSGLSVLSEESLCDYLSGMENDAAGIANNEYRCPKCKDEFDYLADKEAHDRYHHQAVVWYCGCIITHSISIAHQLFHNVTVADNLKCKPCKMGFRGSEALKRHLNDVHKDDLSS